MPRVIGIDPGTVSIDLCGLDDGRLFLDRSWPTAEALADPARFVAELEAAGPLDLVVGPSGYGLPITRVQDITEEALRLAFLAAPGETGGIGGLRNLVRALARTALPVVLTPGVVHLPTVPAHRKVNRVDMGTAEKVCAVAFAASDQARRLGSPLSNVSLVLLELGGARSEEHTSELQSQSNLVCRLLLEKKKKEIKDSVGVTSCDRDYSVYISLLDISYHDMRSAL